MYIATLRNTTDNYIPTAAGGEDTRLSPTDGTQMTSISFFPTDLPDSSTGNSVITIATVLSIAVILIIIFIVWIFLIVVLACVKERHHHKPRELQDSVCSTSSSRTRQNVENHLE